ncbi:MAG: YtxH domain-containing protein [Actinobacteria bacterium]|nr:YtxH domain-containing protein [Actinomycetota bacterium]
MAQLKGLPERSLKLVQEAASKADSDALRNALLALTVGLSSLAMGLIIGMLFAPRRGSETRDRIAQSINRASDEIQQSASNAAKEVARVGSRAQDTIQTIASRIKRSA